MAKKKNTIPSGFDDILGNIYSNPSGAEEVTNIDDFEENIRETPLVEENEDEEPPVSKPEDGSVADEPQSSELEDQVDPQTTNDQVPSTTEDITPTEDVTDDDVTEAQQVGLLFDALGASLGWNMNEIDEKDRPLTVDDLVEQMKQVVILNSVPQYADDRILALDEYVKNGGKFEDFYSKLQETLTLDNINLEDESNQKAVVRELMRRDGYSDEQINKKISRYEDSDMLYEESEDALDRLRLIRKVEIEEATRQLEEEARLQEERSKQFFTSVSNEINSLTNIRGIAIPKEDRKALFDYIFKVDQTGKSQYTKDFEKNLSKNLIESAYFTMKADALISTAKATGETSAAEKLRKMLRHSAKNHSTYNADDKQKSVTDMVKGMF